MYGTRSKSEIFGSASISAPQGAEGLWDTHSAPVQVHGMNVNKSGTKEKENTFEGGLHITLNILHLSCFAPTSLVPLQEVHNQGEAERRFSRISSIHNHII